jgi:release factor glutamine methyltransferase
MPSPEPATWRDLLAGTGGIPETTLRWWLSDFLNCPLTRLPLEDTPTEADREAFRQAAERLAAHEPVQYVCGRTPFRSLVLTVTPDVLIPRPETEQLVQLALDRMIRPGDRVLDVGTGSGCIALSLKQERPDLEVEATDVSNSALEVARKNAQRLGLDVQFRQADLLASEAPSSWDVIISNPPYIGTGERAGLPPEVREFEPSGALFSGADGLDHLRILLEQSQQALAPEGRLVIETGETQGPALDRLAGSCGFKIEHIKDLAGRERFRLLSRTP